jgi:ribosomal 30S subunit maturation factor RimM
MQGRFKFKSKQMQMIQVASIKSVHGVRGDLVIAHQITKKAALQVGDALLIEFGILLKENGWFISKKYNQEKKRVIYSIKTVISSTQKICHWQKRTIGKMF